MTAYQPPPRRSAENECPRLNHHHAGPRCRPARRGRADAGLRARHRSSRCARAGRHRHDGAAPRHGRHGSPPPAAEQAGHRPRRHRHRRQHPPARRSLRRQPPLRRQADLRPASGARRRAQRGRLHHSRVGRGARRAVRAGRRRARAAFRVRLVPAPGHTRGMQVVVVETGGRPVVVGGDVAVWFGGSTSRTPKASCECARSTPSWSGSRTSTSRGDPAPSKASTPALSGPPGFRAQRRRANVADRSVRVRYAPIGAADGSANRAKPGAMRRRENGNGIRRSRVVDDDLRHPAT